MNRWKRIHKVNFNLELWKKLYYKHQQAQFRNRLLAIKYLFQGDDKLEVCRLLSITLRTLRKWLDIFLRGGFKELLAPIKRQRKEKLSYIRKKILKFILLHKTPSKYGFDVYIWTLKIIQQLLKKRWGVELKPTRIYEILQELNLSHQRVHRDYINASKSEQREFVANLKDQLNQAGEKDVFIWFDEFSVVNRPSPFYGWGEKNSTPTISSDEKRKRERINGFVGVDNDTGETFFESSPKGNSLYVACFLLSLVLIAEKKGMETLYIILDNCPSHKKKMRKYLYNFMELLDLEIKVEFIDTPRYSPKFNLSEYIIHLIRLNILHHQPADMKIDEIEKRLKRKLKEKQLQTREQIQNTVRHIFKLAG